MGNFQRAAEEKAPSILDGGPSISGSQVSHDRNWRNAGVSQVRSDRVALRFFLVFSDRQTLMESQLTNQVGKPQKPGFLLRSFFRFGAVRFEED
jgi:hypothetical protein